MSDTEQKALKKQLEETSKDLDSTSFAVPLDRSYKFENWKKTRNVFENWKKGRRNSSDYFRTMKAVANSPWYYEEDGTVGARFKTAFKKLGRLSFMAVGSVPAGISHGLQAITKIPSNIGKNIFRKAGKLISSKNPFAIILGGLLYPVGALFKSIDYANRLIYGPLSAATRLVFASKLDKDYGINAEKQMEVKNLKAVADVIVKDTDKLKSLSAALKEKNLGKRREEVEKVIKSTEPLKNITTEKLSDQTLGQILELTRESVKQKERELIETKKLPSRKDQRTI